MTLCYSQMVAQDIHFSQFYASPLSLNPAQTGWYNGDLRVSSNYRTQWRAIDNKAFQTVSLGLEKQFYHYTNSYSVGMIVISDKTGYVGLITDKALLSGSFTKRYRGHKITAALQLGATYKYTYTMQYTYDDQFDLGGETVFNPDFATGENLSQAALYMNVNAGMMWTKRFNKRLMPEAGISFYNINRPNESIYGLDYGSTHLPLRTSFHFGGKYSINKNIHICPNVLYMYQNKAVDFIVGGNVEYDLSTDMTCFGGTIFRYGMQKNYDASAWLGGVRYKNMQVGLSYDINISSLHTATQNRGAFEISFIYITPSIQSMFIKIPCDRL